MNFATISAYHGFVVRTKALAERGVSRRDLMAAFEVDAPLDEAAGLISFGPHFGPEASDFFFAKLQDLGLRYVDDFFNFALDAPEWVSFAASCNAAG